jgi:hypothetical protein
MVCVERLAAAAALHDIPAMFDPLLRITERADCKQFVHD